MEIIETEWGCANAYSDRIEINKNLRDFPELREKVIQHEIEHSKNKGFWKNRKIDALTDLKFKDLLPFYKKNKRAFIQQHLPITYSRKEKTLYFEWSLIFLYLFYISLGTLIAFILKTFSTDSAMFWKIVGNIFFVGVIAIFLYFGIKELIKYVNKEAKKNEKKKEKSD